MRNFTNDSVFDDTIPTGGFGFFSEAGEVATIQYVTVSERSSLGGRLRALF